ncbi:MAG: hypothetical protein M3O02_11280 [Acidobacteriota bacterium]|nr:hypothetical protein [Acidobacteriota bacterium]
MSLHLVTPPAVLPVTLSELKLQLGFGPMEDTDQLREQIVAEQIRPAITAATDQCEAICARAFITQTWRMTLDGFPRWHERYEIEHRNDITIPLPTFQTLDAFTYIDPTGTVQDVMAAGGWGYQLVSGGDRQTARLRPKVAEPWPFTLVEQADAVAITFTCGFGDTPGAVPYAVRAAVKLCAEWIYNGSKGIQPPAIAALLSPYVIDIV